jgi:hypothetical protein
MVFLRLDVRYDDDEVQMATGGNERELIPSSGCCVTEGRDEVKGELGYEGD